MRPANSMMLRHETAILNARAYARTHMCKHGPAHWPKQALGQRAVHARQLASGPRLDKYGCCHPEAAARGPAVWQDQQISLCVGKFAATPAQAFIALAVKEYDEHVAPPGPVTQNASRGSGNCLICLKKLPGGRLRQFIYLTS